MVFFPQELADETNKLSDTAQFLEQQCLPLYYAETPKDMNINANHSMNQKAGYLNMRFKVSNSFNPHDCLQSKTTDKTVKQ